MELFPNNLELPFLIIFYVRHVGKKAHLTFFRSVLSEKMPFWSDSVSFRVLVLNKIDPGNK